jgi:hypothetical protein
VLVNLRSGTFAAKSARQSSAIGVQTTLSNSTSTPQSFWR